MARTMAVGCCLVGLLVGLAGCSERDGQPAPLSPSGETGLLGAPLPVGAVLIERLPGRPARLHDARESYRITASADEIAAFFEREMPKGGWSRDGASQKMPTDWRTKFILFFTKRNAMLGVLIDRDGGSFLLMGS